MPKKTEAFDRDARRHAVSQAGGYLGWIGTV